MLFFIRQVMQTLKRIFTRFWSCNRSSIRSSRRSKNKLFGLRILQSGTECRCRWAPRSNAWHGFAHPAGGEAVLQYLQKVYLGFSASAVQRFPTTDCNPKPPQKLEIVNVTTQLFFNTNTAPWTGLPSTSITISTPVFSRSEKHRTEIFGPRSCATLSRIRALDRTPGSKGSRGEPFFIGGLEVRRGELIQIDNLKPSSFYFSGFASW